MSRVAYREHVRYSGATGTDTSTAVDVAEIAPVVALQVPESTEVDVVEKLKVYEALARAFAEEGTNTVFGLMGDGNMLWMATMAKTDGVSLVHARHENAAVAMADG